MKKIVLGLASVAFLFGAALTSFGHDPVTSGRYTSKTDSVQTGTGTGTSSYGDSTKTTKKYKKSNSGKSDTYKQRTDTTHKGNM